MKTIEQLMKTGKCEKCDGKLVCVNYDRNNIENVYDGWGELMCVKCGHRRGRWSGKVLIGEEEENVRNRF